MNTDKTKQPGTFRYISLGDVHLGHRGTPTHQILQNLRKTITDDMLREIDMLIITGDLFDRQLQNGDDDVHLINRWITELLMRCSVFNVIINIVEGTPSHDRKQSKFFTEQKENANIDVEVHYISTLTIKYFEQFDAYFLYVPDKYNPSTAVTLAEVKKQMAALGLEKVDFAIMHGAFSYQLPAIVPEPTHDENEYLALVRYQILIGHVHIMTVNERILAAGSFDRLWHNDEEPKGLFKVCVRENGEWDRVFIENEGARKYITIECHGMDTRELLHAVKSRFPELPKHSAIRLRCDTGDVATGDIEAFKRTYPLYEWSLAIEKSTQKKKNSVSETFKAFDMSKYSDITKDSILGLLVEDLEKLGVSNDVVQRCLGRLPEYL